MRWASGVCRHKLLHVKCAARSCCAAREPHSRSCSDRQRKGIYIKWLTASALQCLVCHYSTGTACIKKDTLIHAKKLSLLTDVEPQTPKRLPEARVDAFIHQVRKAQVPKFNSRCADIQAKAQTRGRQTPASHFRPNTASVTPKLSHTAPSPLRSPARVTFQPPVTRCSGINVFSPPDTVRHQQ